jgi:hypothetical protein
MNLEQWLSLGAGLARNPDVRAALKRAVDMVPAGALAVVGLGRASALAIAGGVVGGFAVGAATGAGLVLFLGPDGDKHRREMAERVEQLKQRLVAAGRNTETRAQQAVRSMRTPSPDDTLVPRP